MALNLSASQYEAAFDPKKLCNWEIPKKTSVQPKKRSDITKVIVDDRGHLLPGIPRVNKNPWAGLYIGTYHLPKKITRKVADDIACGKMLTSWEKRSSHVPILNAGGSKNQHMNECKNNNQEEMQETRKTEKPSTPVEHSRPPSAKPDIPSKSKGPILSNVYCDDLVAKNLMRNNQKHHTLADVVDNQVYSAEQMRRSENPGLSLKLESEAAAVGCKLFDSPGPTQCSKLKVFRPKTAAPPSSKSVTPRPKTTSRIRRAPMSAMDLALYWDLPFPKSAGFEQQTAPAVFAVVPRVDYQKEVTDAEVPSLVGSYKTHQKIRSENKSAVMNVIKDEQEASTESVRNSTPSKSSARSHSPNLHKTSRHSSIKSKSSVDLRCSPPTPEKKDLSRHSSAKSTPRLNLQKLDSQIPQNQDQLKSLRLHELSPNADKRGSLETQNSFSAKSGMLQIPSPLRQNSADNMTTALHDQKYRSNAEPKADHCPSCTSRTNLHTNALKSIGVQVRSADFTKRQCLACHPRCFDRTTKPEYKSAFKAGVPYIISNPERVIKSKTFRVPKPRVPFIRKSYTIGTLEPPFSMRPTVTGQDYPDYWRLNTIYRHSYKPPMMRKTPMIKTVFQ